jgi:hypothetical protein
MLSSLLFLSALPAGVWGADILSTNGFSTCGAAGDINVQKMNIQYNRATNKVTFDVAGTSNKEQKVMASLVVTAYGKQVYQKTFNPCDADSKVDQLCPSKLLPYPYLTPYVSNQSSFSTERQLLSRWFPGHSSELRRHDPWHCIHSPGFGWNCKA